MSWPFRYISPHARISNSLSTIASTRATRFRLPRFTLRPAQHHMYAVPVGDCYLLTYLPALSTKNPHHQTPRGPPIQTCHKDVSAGDSTAWNPQLDLTVGTHSLNFTAWRSAVSARAALRPGQPHLEWRFQMQCSYPAGLAWDRSERPPGRRQMSAPPLP